MTKLYLYLLEQDDNSGYDTYDSCVVVAKNEEKAKEIKPTSRDWNDPFTSWARSPDKVRVTKVGLFAHLSMLVNN